MSDNKLTPRVGDRVIVRAQYIRPAGLRTHIGTVRAKYDDGWYLSVQVDGQDAHWRVSVDEVEVVDREPVEWPEGWEDYGDDYVLHEPSNVAIDKDSLKHILTTGPDMLSRWDELMGGHE